MATFRQLDSLPGSSDIPTVAPASGDPLWRRAGAGSWEPDLRALYSPEYSLDERGVWSLLQFGALMPPFSVWRDVEQLVPGVDWEKGDTSEERVGPPETLSIDVQVQRVLSLIDRRIIEASTNRAGQARPLVILFSGGVDSGLLAARAAALGLRDAVLVNYCFGDHDAESALAEGMARHLGLRFHRIHSETGNAVEDVLSNAARYYRVPFGDHSAVPTCALVQTVIREFGYDSAVLDGTGADGAFGMAGKASQWQRLHSLPKVIRAGGAEAYEWLTCATRVTPLESRLRLLRRSSQLPFPLAAVAQNPLDGIAYEFPDAVREEVIDAGRRWVHRISTGDARAQLTALDMALVCACIFAQKSRSLYAEAGVEVCYPFLSREMFSLAMEAVHWPGAEGDSKWVLKTALARAVPPDMVYRPKSGFVEPSRGIFSQPSFVERFRRLTQAGSPLAPWLRRKALRGIERRLVEGSDLPAQTANFVWAAVFVNEWLSQVARVDVKS